SAPWPPARRPSRRPTASLKSSASDPKGDAPRARQPRGVACGFLRVEPPRTDLDVSKHTTFGGYTPVGGVQAYPDAYPAGVHIPFTGAVETNTLGTPPYHIFHICVNMVGASPSLSLKFSASGLQELSDESWGLDNVAVSVTDPLLSGWTVYLDQNQNGQRDSNEEYTVTDDGGSYAFSGLPPGQYGVAEAG